MGIDPTGFRILGVDRFSDLGSTSTSFRRPMGGGSSYKGDISPKVIGTNSPRIKTKTVNILDNRTDMIDAVDEVSNKNANDETSAVGTKKTYVGTGTSVEEVNKMDDKLDTSLDDELMCKEVVSKLNDVGNKGIEVVKVWDGEYLYADDQMVVDDGNLGRSGMNNIVGLGVEALIVELGREGDEKSHLEGMVGMLLQQREHDLDLIEDLRWRLLRAEGKEYAG